MGVRDLKLMSKEEFDKGKFNSLDIAYISLHDPNQIDEVLS